jgi:transforming growth factor-beta-induced protein
VKLDNRANVTAVDIAASNGVIHVIDKVLIPGKISQMVMNNPNLSMFADAIVYADLATFWMLVLLLYLLLQMMLLKLYLKLIDKESLTSFPKERVIDILYDHFITGNVTSKDLVNGTYDAFNGNKITVSGVGTAPKLNVDINISTFDIQGTKSVLHLIDKVIFVL